MAAETIVEEMLSLGGRYVEVIHVDAAGDPNAESGPIWRCGCGRGSDWPLVDPTGLLDPLKLVSDAARGHAAHCTR